MTGAVHDKLEHDATPVAPFAGVFKVAHAVTPGVQHVIAKEKAPVAEL